MTSPGAPPVPWHAVARFHREVASCAWESFFALPVTASAIERWGSLARFELEHFGGPWEMDFQALESSHLRRVIQERTSEAFIGGPCWFRWMSEDEQSLEWIPLIYRKVQVQCKDNRLHIEPVQGGWHVCPLMSRFLVQHQIQTVAPLEEILPDLLPLAESKAANDGKGLTHALIDAFQLTVPEIGELLVRARDNFPADRVESVPSPWVLFTVPAEEPTTVRHTVDDYRRLERHLAASPQDIGGLGLLDQTTSAVAPKTPGAGKIHPLPILPLNDSQQAAVAAALAGPPITVISTPPGRAKNEVVLSILLNAWAIGKSAVFVSHDREAPDALQHRLKVLEREYEIAIHAGAPQSKSIDEALGRTLDGVKAKRGENHFGGSPTRAQLTSKKQQLLGLLDNQVPQRIVQAIEKALESHAAQREARSALDSQREELVTELRALGVEDEPDAFLQRVLHPLRKWREGIDAAHRLMAKDAQRRATLQNELSAARKERDSVLAAYEIETQPDQECPWLLAEPGFRSFEKGMLALSDKLSEPIEDLSADASWKKAYDTWPSAAAATDWERRALEMVSLLRPAGIGLQEKTEEVNAAHAAVDLARRNMQKATKTATPLDVRREDLDQWATCYEGLRALPRPKFSFLPMSKSTELIHQLEAIEAQFRMSFPSDLWTSIGTLDEEGRARLSTIVERAREWVSARDNWDRMGPVREEIEVQTDALRSRLVKLGEHGLSTEVSPTGCAELASKLKARASIATLAAAAWSKREARGRLPEELLGLAKQIHAAGKDAPIKQRWMSEAGTPLMTALDALKTDSGDQAIATVRQELLRAVEKDSILKIWRQVYEAEEQAVATAEELERIPPDTARVTHWRSHQPPLPTTLNVEGAYDGDENHAVWVFLRKGEEWSKRWTSFRDQEAPALEQRANAEGAQAVHRIDEAAKLLPQGKTRAWLQVFASASAVSKPWPMEEITEKMSSWRPERLQAQVVQIDAQLEHITYETAKNQWLQRVTHDGEILRSMEHLRDHYRNNHQCIEEDAYPHFEQALKAQPVWIATAMSGASIPMQPNLFDLLVVNEATQCTLTKLLPFIFRAKRLVVIGDPEQSSPVESRATQTERALAARFGVEEWQDLLGHLGDNFYKTVGNLPHRQGDVLSLADGE